MALKEAVGQIDKFKAQLMARGFSQKLGVDYNKTFFLCETVCRLALERRYRLLPHLYTLFYNAHTKGDLVMSPLFFADTTDPKLRKVDDSFLLGPMLVSLSKDKKTGSSAKQTIFPHGIWKEFNFDDSHDDLPLLFLKGGSIIPTGPVVQKTEEMLSSNELTLIIALDGKGQAEGLLYEDEGDGFEYQKGKYSLTLYEASLQGDEVLVKVRWSKGQLQRQRRALIVHLLVGETAKVVFSGIDGDDMKFKLPKSSEIAKLVAEGKRKKECTLKDNAEVPNGVNSVEAPKEMVELIGGDWKVKVIPWIGGRIISMTHLPTGIDWLWNNVDMSGYAEYSGTEFQSPGSSEEYKIVKQVNAQNGKSENMVMEGEIGGGLAMQRSISLLKGSVKSIQINSHLVAKSDMAGSGGFSRVVCLRVHPTFQLRNPLETCVSFTSLDGDSYTLYKMTEELCLQGDARPNGEWMLVDKCANASLVNKFNLEEVEQCVIYWGNETCTLELRSTERPVSKTSPMSIHHAYEIIYEEI